MNTYSKNDIISAIKKVGIEKGDSIFVHSNVGFFGKLDGAVTSTDYYGVFKEAIFECLVEHGTLVMPTFSYSFCHGEIFDPENTAGQCGMLSELMRSDKDAVRSIDANFSIIAIGENADFFTENPPENSFGENCFWERLMIKKGKICNFNFDAASTFIHYVEKCLNVFYRYDKSFDGIMKINGLEEKRKFIHYVYDLGKKEHQPDFFYFDSLAKERGLAICSALGKGQIISISCQNMFDLIKEKYQEDKDFLILKGKNER